MSRGSIVPRPPCSELEVLLERRNATTRSRAAVDRKIERRFRCICSVFVLDMAGFSLSVQRHGIIHHLAKIHRMRAVVGRAVGEDGGTVVKFEADNCFATFPTVVRAVRAAIRINDEFGEVNGSASIHVSIGIGHGPILLARDDLFGDEVNLASKLGEDIAGHGEVLLTKRARRAMRGGRLRLEPLTLSISGITLEAARLVGNTD
jgi:adenylate cyclase